LDDTPWGALITENQGFFSGEIDEVRTWNVVRSKEEIQDTLDRSLTGNEPGLVSYWQFDEDNWTGGIRFIAFRNHRTA